MQLAVGIATRLEECVHAIRRGAYPLFLTRGGSNVMDTSEVQTYIGEVVEFYAAVE